MSISSLAILAFCWGAGFGLVYLPLSVLAKSFLKAPDEAEETVDPEPATENSIHEEQEEEPEEARELLLHVYAMAASVTRDANIHAAEMESINHELTDEEPTQEKVLAAIERVVRANEQMKDQLTSAKETIEAQAEAIGGHLADALTDALTCIPNRRALNHELQRRLAEFQRKSRPFSLLICDVDHFKQFNDTHGHLVGDEVLREIASRISNSVRNMDLAARYGGEEFGVVLPETEAESAKVVVERIRRKVCECPFDVDGKELTVTASFGLTQTLREDDTEETMIKRADEALYESKEAGRNCGHVHLGDRRERIELPEPAEPEAASPDPPPPEPPGPDFSEEETVGTDESSRLAKRLAFKVEVEKAITGLPTQGGELSVLLVEVDDYFRVVAAHKGAEVTIAQGMGDLLGTLIGESGTTARYTDHQFAVLLPDQGINSAMSLANELRRAAADEKLDDPTSTSYVTLSIGVTGFRPGENSDELLTRVERTVRAASNAGKDCVYVHRQGQLRPAEESASCAAPLVPTADPVPHADAGTTI